MGEGRMGEGGVRGGGRVRETKREIGGNWQECHISTGGNLLASV